MNSERKASSSALSDIVFSSLDLCHAAIDVELDSGHVTRLVRCEEGNSFGDLIRISQPAQRNVPRKVAFHLRQRGALLPGAEKWRVDQFMDLACPSLVHAHGHHRLTPIDRERAWKTTFRS